MQNHFCHSTASMHRGWMLLMGHRASSTGVCSGYVVPARKPCSCPMPCTPPRHPGPMSTSGRPCAAPPTRNGHPRPSPLLARDTRLPRHPSAARCGVRGGGTHREHPLRARPGAILDEAGTAVAPWGRGAPGGSGSFQAGFARGTHTAVTRTNSKMPRHA